MLKFNAVKFQNKSSGFSVIEDSLPVTLENDRYILPSEDDILVKVHAAALNPADAMIKNSFPSWICKADKGFGMDYSGEVVAIGAAAKAVTGFEVNDRISGFIQDFLGVGSVSEYLLINPKQNSGVNARKIPGPLSYQEGAAYPLVLGTAQSMFDSVNKKNSFHKVLILGAGTAVGRYCVQLASNVYGSKNIVVTCSPRTEETILQLGATSVIDYTKHRSLLNPVLESVKDSGQFDVILDCCGNSDLFPQMETILKSREHFGSYVTIVGDKKADFYTFSFLSSLFGGLTVALRAAKSWLGFLPYFYSQIFLDVGGPWPDKCVEILQQGKVKIFIDSEYDMAEIQQAVDRLQSNKASGKIIINIG